MSGWMLFFGLLALVGASCIVVGTTLFVLIAVQAAFRRARGALRSRRSRRLCGRATVGELSGGRWTEGDDEIYRSGFAAWREMFSEYDSE